MPTDTTATRFRDKWRLMPDRGGMTFFRRSSVGPPATYDPGQSLVQCWHRNYQTAPQPGNPGVYLLKTCEIYVPKVPNASFSTAATQPMPGDLINDNRGNAVETDSSWYVQETTEAGSLGAWLLRCVYPVINSGVAIAVKFQNPTETITDSGQRVVTAWSDISSGDAWVQQQDTTADDILGCRTFALQATIYSETYVDVTAQTTVLEVDSGYRYTITGVRSAQSLAELNEYRLERIP